jgi:hypothetical protein
MLHIWAADKIGFVPDVKLILIELKITDILSVKWAQMLSSCCISLQQRFR